MTKYGKKFLFFLAVVFILDTGNSFSQEEASFYGRWALYLPGGAGWLKIYNDEDNNGNEYPVADLLWYGGSVTRRIEKPDMHNNKLTVWRTHNVDRKHNLKGEVIDRQQVMTRIELELINDNEIVGREISPHNFGMDVNIKRFRGKRIPDPGPAPDISNMVLGDPENLFNGDDLAGWKLINEKHKNGWIVKNGILSNNPVQKGDHKIHYGNLRTERKFEDFNLKIDVNIPPKNNSGIYLRGIYEVQVVDSYGKELDSHNMGALYSRIVPSIQAEKPAGEWQTFDITLYKRHLTVILNGKKIIDNKPIYGCTGGAITADEFLAGPIYLQGDHGEVSYRNIILTPILK